MKGCFMNIYLDCDEVLLETAKAHHLMREENFHIKDDLNKYPSQWKYTHPELSSYEKSTLEFITNYRFSGIFPVKNAVKGVHRLKQAGFKLHIVTSISEDRLTQIYRNKNLQYYFGDVFETVTCLPLGHDNKKEYYRKADIGIVIDDSALNIIDAISCGHQGIFMAIPQNKEWHEKMRTTPNVQVKKDLLDAANFIIQTNCLFYKNLDNGKQR